jgi:hypothetical protein
MRHSRKHKEYAMTAIEAQLIERLKKLPRSGSPSGWPGWMR